MRVASEGKVGGIVLAGRLRFILIHAIEAKGGATELAVPPPITVERAVGSNLGRLQRMGCCGALALPPLKGGGFVFVRRTASGPSGSRLCRVAVAGRAAVSLASTVLPRGVDMRYDACIPPCTEQNRCPESSRLETPC